MLSKKERGIPGREKMAQAKSQRWKTAGGFQGAVRAGLLGAEAGTGSVCALGPWQRVGDREQGATLTRSAGRLWLRYCAGNREREGKIKCWPVLQELTV